MLYLIFKWFYRVVLPELGAVASIMLTTLMAIIITIAGILMLFSAIGINISNNLGSTVTNGVFRALGAIFRGLFRAIAWFLRNLITVWIPTVFRGTRNWFNQLGFRPVWSTLFSVIVTILFVIIII